MYKKATKDAFPQSEFKVIERKVLVNDDSTGVELRKALNRKLFNYIQNIKNPKDQKNEYAKAISSMAEIDFKNDSDFFKDSISNLTALKENVKIRRLNKTKEFPKSFEELFYNPKNIEVCLQILREIDRPAIDAVNNYIGNAKGVFPIWIRLLQHHDPPIIKTCSDIIYSKILNKEISNLKLTKDASEFRKIYKRLENSDIKLHMKTILSQFSQAGKLGR